MMRKYIILFVAMLFLFSVVGCSGSTTSDSADQTGQQQQQSTIDSTQQQSSANADQQKQATSSSDSTSTSTSSSSNSTPAASSKSSTGTGQAKQQTSKAGEKSNKNPIVTIEMEDGQKIKVELYPDVAPNTVRNFISLVKKGFYNGLIFHRVIPGFMIQGGDPSGNGSGGPDYSIKGEFNSNGFTNNLKHTRGVISMGYVPNLPDSAGSQFFIMHQDYPSLDGQYAAFGKVLSGMEEVDKIVNVQRDANDKPLTPQKMKKVTVDTFGVNYGDPIKVTQ